MRTDELPAGVHGSSLRVVGGGLGPRWEADAAASRAATMAAEGALRNATLALAHGAPTEEGGGV